MFLAKYSIGMGDRFAHQAVAQLRAVALAGEQGVEVTPVWNKSHREHTTVGSQPIQLRKKADEAVATLGWNAPYHVDADHINLSNVDLFVEASDFFTLDVADAIGQASNPTEVRDFVERHADLIGHVEIPGLDEPFDVVRADVEAIAGKYLGAVAEATRIHRRIEAARGKDNFIIEVSMDETDEAQTPVEMLFILAALADAGVPAQTIAPKFTGRFNKGVDYVGDVAGFSREFKADLAIIAFAVERFGLPSNLKLSMHSGSDKFSLYGPIRLALRKFDAGLHLKTAGCHWLEELVGLAMAGGEGAAIVKEIYRAALGRFDAFRAPYATVLDIDPAGLPTAEVVDGWSGEELADALRHDPTCPRFNPNFRQLLHVAYKVAAEMGDRYLDALERYEPIVSRNVIENILTRHLKRVFF